MKRTTIAILCITLGAAFSVALVLNSWIPASGGDSINSQEKEMTARPLPEKKFNERPTKKMGSFKNPEKALMQQITSMSLEDKISQMLYVGIEGTTLNRTERQMITNSHVGGVILLGGNVKSNQQLKALLSSIKQANKSYSIPLFLGIDEEGGRVSRIPDLISNLPSSQQIGDEHKPKLARKVGKLLAKKVKNYGFNMNFAPVLDINNNPNNVVIGDRSFGETPERVTQMGIAEMKGIQSENIIPVVKHFPGHGDTSVDSHVNLPIIRKSLEKLMNFELEPFQAAVNQGADAIMLAHILFPKLDEQFPATMSSDIIQDVLRKKLGFNGLIITDDMAMGAIAENYGSEEAATRSIQAGADMLLLTDTKNGNYQQVKRALIQAVQNERISEKEVNDSVKRILTLKRKYHLQKQNETKVNINQLNQEINKIIQTVN